MKKLISLFLAFAGFFTMTFTGFAANTHPLQSTNDAIITLESVKYPGYFVNTWAGNGKTNGTKITLYRFDGTTDQWYRIEHLGNGEYYIRVYSSKNGMGKVLDIYWGKHKSKVPCAGMTIDSWDPLKSEEKFQKFVIEIHEDGTVSFLVAADKNLAIAVNNGENGSKLVLKKYSSSDKAIRFKLCDTKGNPLQDTTDSDSNEVQEKLDLLLKGKNKITYKGKSASARQGTVWSDFKSNLWGWQCKGFASAVFYELYGYNIAAAYYKNNRHVLKLTDSDKTETVFSTKRPTLTQLTVLLKQAEPGDFCQISNAKIQHSMIVYSVEEDGIIFVDANYAGNNKIAKHKMTWKQIYNYMGSSAYGISLYRNKD
jgi:hypothetical protein